MITVIVAANLECQSCAGALSPRGRLTVAAGGPGDALVMCPAEGDSLGAAKDIAAGPCQPAAGH